MENKNKSFWIKFKTTLLMWLPLGFYIFILKKISVTRLANYSGILGTNPKSVIVGDGIVLIDLDDMVI